MERQPVSYRSREFDEFLYSVIREEESGVSLTVLSVLARQEMDPWEAAEELAREPWSVAAARLSSLIAIAPSDTASPQAPDSVAIHLLDKLLRLSLVRRPIAGMVWESLTDLMVVLKARIKTAGQTKRGKERL